MFVNTYFGFGQLDPEACASSTSAGLGISEQQVFDLMVRHGQSIVRWVKALDVHHPTGGRGAKAKLFQDILRVVTKNADIVWGGAEFHTYLKKVREIFGAQ